jgi:hypothetical protein
MTLAPRALPPALLALCPDHQCDLCAITFNGPSISSSHYNGKAHAKKVQLYLESADFIPEDQKPKKLRLEQAPPPPATGGGGGATGLFCNTCNLVCTSQVS